MDQRLKEASQAGNTDILYYLIGEDPYLLDRIDEVPFVDTPLHVAASAGNIEFAMEVMNLKASFSRKLNPDGFSPMNLALLNNQNLFVFWLLDMDPDLVRVKGRGGMTPLHHAAEQGNLTLLTEFFTACPESIKDVTIKGDTAFHIAVRNNRIEAFQVLMGWLKRMVIKDAAFWEREILNWKNKEGNTVMHLAVFTGQHQVAKLLMGSFVYTNIKNSDGMIAMDMLQGREIIHRESWKLGVRRGLHHGILSTDTCSIDELKTMSHGNPVALRLARSRWNTSPERRNALLVVYGLIATIMYQAALNPPGGVWQGSADINSPIPQTVHVNAASRSLHYVGTSVMSSEIFTSFWIANTAIFVVSIVRMIFMTLPEDENEISFPPSIFWLLSCYAYSMAVISPTKDWSSFNMTMFSTLIQSFFNAIALLFLNFILAKHKQARRRTRQSMHDRKEWW